MSFLEFMVSSTEYQNLNSLFGLGRVILWLIIQIMVMVCNLVEGIYNHIFSLFNVVYSDSVVNFIQSWIGFLWIPIAISIIILGYNLIMGDESEGKVKIKTFGRNICLLALIIFGLPYLFIGHAGGNSSAVFIDKNTSGYSSSGNITSGNPGLIDFFTNDNGNGIITGVSELSGMSQSGASHTYGLVIQNIYDLKHIYKQAEQNTDNINSKTWSSLYIDGEKITKNTYQYISNGKVVNKKGDSILNVNVCEIIDYDDVGNIGDGDLTVVDVMADGYDYGIFFKDDNSKDDIHEYLVGDTADTEGLTSNSNYKPSEVKARDWLFKSIHNEVIRQYDDDENVKQVFYSSEGKTQSGVIFGLGSTFPFRYRVEWGTMFIQLIATTIILLLTSYKIARIIYEITVNQFLALFFGAADLSNGQRVREILKSIVSLLLSLLFAVVLVEFYFIVSSAVNTITFSSDFSANNWMRALVNLFVAMAAVKGPSVLEKVLGVEGGLSGAWRDMASVNRMTKPARNAAKTAVKGAAIMGAAGGYFAYKRHQGKSDERTRHKNGNQRKIGGPRDKSRTEVAGNESQFSAARRSGSNLGRSPEEQMKTASGNNAANAEMARQSRDISGEINNKNANEAANKYRSNIQNAAMAEQANARLNGDEISDREALQRAYENSGFDAEQSESLASRDVAEGSYSDKKEKFENSISAKAQQKLSDSPLDYQNQMEAYNEAATDHYKALGFDDATAQSMAEETAGKVLVDDKQGEIRTRASEMMRTNPDLSETDAINTASQEVLNSRSVGYTGSTLDAGTQIISQGTLKEGVKSGRIANNVIREKAETNTRSSSLRNDMNPAAKAAATMVGGYFVERAAETLHQTGTAVGSSSYSRKNAKRTERQYKKLQRGRK